MVIIYNAITELVLLALSFVKVVDSKLMNFVKNCLVEKSFRNEALFFA